MKGGGQRQAQSTIERLAGIVRVNLRERGFLMSKTMVGKSNRCQTQRQLLLASSALMVTALAATGASAQNSVIAQSGVATQNSAAVSAPNQAQPDAAISARGQQVTGGVEEIVVTARRRTESAQDVPVSITAISAAQIDRLDLTSLEKIASVTPQLAIGRNATGSGAQLTLRGVGSNSLSIGTEQSIAVIVDGVYYGQGRTINDGFFDLAGAQVLKGPQSLFYGKNATAGVISITTANPTDTLTAQVRGTYEFKGQTVKGEGYLSGPLTDNLGFRIAVRASKDYGSLYANNAGPVTYVTRDTPTATTVGDTTTHIAPAPKNDGPNERDFLTRATLRWQPTDRVTATLKANYGLNKTRPGTWNYVVYACANGTSTLTGVPCTRDFAGYRNDTPPDIAAATAYGNDSGVSFNRYESWGVTGTVDYQLDNLSITSVSNYNWNKNNWSNDLDYQSSNTSSIFGTELTSYHAYSSELRVLSQFDSPVNFLIGGYYQDTNRQYDQTVVFAGSENSDAPPGFRYVGYAKDSSTDGKTLSGYGQLIWKIVPEIEATGGVRYIHETKGSFFVQPYANPIFAGSRYAVNQPLNADQTFDNWSPEATLTWTPTSDITVYGAYKTAYKSGGFSNSSIQSPTTPLDFFTFQPEKASGFEGGVKTTLFDRQLRFNVGLYTYKYTDLQVTYLDSARLSYNSINAGSVRTKGVEVELEYAPRAISGLVINGTANYNRARYGDSIAPCYGGQRLNQGCIPDLLSQGTPGQNLAGKPTSDAPLWTASLGASYETPVSNNLVLGGSVNSRYSSSYLPSAFGQELGRQPKYINLDASIRVHTTDDGWELALLGKNLTNQFVVTGVTDGSFTGSGTGTAAGVSADQVGFVSLPRTVQLQLTWRWK